MMRDTFDVILIVAFIALFIGGLIYGVNKYEENCANNPHSCKSEQQLLCEDAGGLYMTGGFGSPNCDFPPNT